jgi:hypothetical protein
MVQIIRFLAFGAHRKKGAEMRREWELEALIDCWTLDEDEQGLLANKSGATRRGSR